MLLSLHVVCRHTATQYQQWKKNMFSQKYWKSALVNAWTTNSFKAKIAMETTENDYDDEWVSYRLHLIFNYEFCLLWLLAHVQCRYYVGKL